MDKKSVERRKRFDNKAKAKCILIVGLVLGLIMVCMGGIQLYQFRKERGTQTVEELNDDSEKFAKEAGEIEAEKLKEFEENGPTEKYLELSEKWAEATTKRTSAEHSLYMEDSGYHNPRNFWEFVVNVPLLFLGVFVMAAGFVASAVVKGRK